MSVQFKETGTANDAGVLLKDIIKLDKPLGKTRGGNGADEIWVYEKGTWIKYYFWSSRNNGNVWVDYSVNTTKADEAIAAETNAALKPGQCFFFIRGASDGVATLSGEVVPLKDVIQLPVKANSTTAMAYPWPTEMAINDFTQFIDKPLGKTRGNNGADEIWVYEKGTWIKYFFWSSRNNGNVWVDYSVNTTKADEAIEATTKAKLLPGQAFFFIRGASDGVLSFKQDAE